MLYEPNSSFDFDKITLGSPNGLQGGSYFTKLLINNEPIYLQIPKCTTKQGLVFTEKKKYCDLMFSRDNTNIIEWFEEIEKKVQELMFSKKNVWFHDDLELSDIENAFTSPIRSYKSGNYYLVRCTLPKVLNSDTISCYNENEEPIDLEVLNEDNVEIIPLIEIQGIKFSSKNFQIELGMRQVMVIKKKDLFKNCMIKVEKDPITPDNNKEESYDNGLIEKIDHIEEPVVESILGMSESIEESKNDKTNNEESNNEESNNEELNNDKTNNEESEVIVEQKTIVYEEPTVEEDDSVAAISLETQNNDNGIEEVNLSFDGENSNDRLVLKQPSEVYYNMWKEARQKAKEAKHQALAAYLEAKKIKENYMLEGIDSDSDEDEFEQPI